MRSAGKYGEPGVAKDCVTCYDSLLGRSQAYGAANNYPL